MFKGKVVALEKREEVYTEKQLNNLKIISKEYDLEKYNDDYKITIFKAKIEHILNGREKRTVVDVPKHLYNIDLIDKHVEVNTFKEDGKYIYTIERVI